MKEHISAVILCLIFCLALCPVLAACAASRRI